MEQKDHFSKVFWFLATTMLLAMAYIFLITFLVIPKDNVRFADTSQGFFLGTIIGGIIAYFAGGSAPTSSKKIDAPGKATADISATITTDPPEDKQVINQ